MQRAKNNQFTFIKEYGAGLAMSRLNAGQVGWFMPVIPATWVMEVEGSWSA
jgi:hypothetical protein